MKPPSVTGLILVGGRSRRFGSDKALAEVDGRPMIAHVYAALAPLCAEVLVSVDGPERRYSLPGPARYVVDAEPGAGPLAGLLAGLAAASTDHVLVLACDLPFVTTDALRVLLGAVTEAAEGVVAHDGERAQPLCAVYARRVRPLAETQLASGRRAMRAFLDGLTVRTVPLPYARLRNVNTRTDLEVTGLHKRSPPHRARRAPRG